MRYLGLIGKKIGMTRIFDENGKATAVTVLDVSGNQVIQKKEKEKDGYTGVQIGFDDQKQHRLNKPKAGHLKKYGADAKKYIKEFRLNDEAEAKGLESGKNLGVDIFEVDQYVDIIAYSKGKGFQGVYKRYGFGGLPSSHGSMMHRRTGAVGAGSTPGKIWKNQKMPGRHGNYKKTVHNLKIVQLREEDNVILISGSIPGAKNGYVLIRPAIRKPNKGKVSK